MPVVVPVKFPFAGRELWFDPHGLDIAEADYAICATERGTEFGFVTANPFEVSRSQLSAPLKPVVRIANDDDLDRADALAARGEAAIGDFRELIKRNGLGMKPVGVEFLFGGEKAVFYFAAEDRVDFRQLIKDLCSRFHERVDMRQIGVRDETRLIGGFAHCGQELCCARFGRQFQPVSIRMAKEQDLPLNSAKISGVCGRLMCCLRYEFEAYKDFKSRAPKKKTLIDTPLGRARILEYDTPKEQLVLRLENGRVFRVDLSEMSCSEACVRHAEEARCPCRPDCVSRAVLERIESPEISLALLDLDREMGVDVGDGLSSDDRIESRPGGARRHRKRDGEASAARGEQSGRKGDRHRRVDEADEDARPQGGAGRRRRQRSPASGSGERPSPLAPRDEVAASDESVPEGRPNRRRRRHAGGEDPERVPRDEPAQSSRRRHRAPEARRPQTSSVADQLADGEVFVRRRPGDQGGSDLGGSPRRARPQDQGGAGPKPARRRRSRRSRRDGEDGSAPQTPAAPRSEE